MHMILPAQGTIGYFFISARNRVFFKILVFFLKHLSQSLSLLIPH